MINNKKTLRRIPNTVKVVRLKSDLIIFDGEGQPMFPIAIVDSVVNISSPAELLIRLSYKVQQTIRANGDSAVEVIEVDPTKFKLSLFPPSDGDHPTYKYTFSDYKLVNTTLGLPFLISHPDLPAVSYTMYYSVHPTTFSNILSENPNVYSGSVEGDFTFNDNVIGGSFLLTDSKDKGLKLGLEVGKVLSKSKRISKLIPGHVYIPNNLIDGSMIIYLGMLKYGENKSYYNEFESVSFISDLWSTGNVRFYHVFINLSDSIENYDELKEYINNNIDLSSLLNTIKGRVYLKSSKSFSVFGVDLGNCIADGSLLGNDGIYLGNILSACKKDLIDSLLSNNKDNFDLICDSMTFVNIQDIKSSPALISCIKEFFREIFLSGIRYIIKDNPYYLTRIKELKLSPSGSTDIEVVKDYLKGSNTYGKNFILKSENIVRGYFYGGYDLIPEKDIFDIIDSITKID